MTIPIVNLKILPKVIETDEELERFSEMLEALDRIERPPRPEGGTLESLLARPIQGRQNRIA